MHQPVRLQRFLDGPWPDRAAILADLDGCLISGETVLPDVPELFARCGERLWIVSNNSSDTAQSLSARLAALGLALPPERILLAGEMTLRALQAARPGARVALYAAEPLQDLSRALGLRPDRARPEAVVLARDPSLSFSDIARIAAFAHAGVPVTLTNPDTSHPGADGTPQPETGALWAAVAAVVPQVRAPSLGKPAPDLPREALRRAGVTAGAAVFIGDTAETDGAAAAAVGVEFIRLTRPGEEPSLPAKTGACTC
ncbi:HAD family hydrolase [Actibacterium sp. MT2.3-13A]|uniref:HAD family hydrolase n=1 Tax=Actibacterium sp. MT2.3-13A TaxID=2828332 RepID=UPI001BAC9314|nr:HAD family hydrolase [Actibacterium sp. MT2.3-13A]